MATKSKCNAPADKSYGIVQKEYVEVPDRLLANTRELRPYFDLSIRYVQTLKPK